MKAMNYLINKMFSFFKVESLCLTVFILYFLPIIFLGENAYILIPDNLNADFFIKYLLSEYNLIYSLDSSKIIPRIYSEGLALKFLSPRFFIGDTFFYLLGNPFNAYILNAISVRLIGFFSFYFFAKSKFKNVKYNHLILISLVYSLIPIYTIYGLTIIGLPILLIAFNNIINNKNFYLSLSLIILYVLYSNVLLYPFIFLIAILVLIKVKFFDNIKFSLSKYFIALLVFIFTILITEYSLLETVLSGESHRSLAQTSESLMPSFMGIVYGLIKKTLIGFDHPSMLVSIPVFIYLLFYFKNISRNAILICILILLNNIIDLTRPILQDAIPQSKVFDLGRINWFNPVLFFLLLLEQHNKNYKKKYVNIIMILVIILQLFFNFFRSPEFSLNIMDNQKASKLFFDDDIFVKNFSSFRSNPYNLGEISLLNYNEFISKNLFLQISNYINKPKDSYRVIGFGIDTSILLMNGFYTIDGYTNNHSKEYHLKFDSIEPNHKLGVSHHLKLFYDKCRNCSKEIGLVSTYDLELNYPLLSSMKCKYIISTVEILNPGSNLNLIKTFTNKVYSIFLYEIVN